jgi:hypothetical protein
MMVDLSLLQSISYMAGALGVCVAAVYYVMNLQMTRRKLKVDNTIFYGNLLSNKETVLQWRHVLYDQHFSSFEEWDKKYRSDPEAYSNLYSTMGMLNQLGMCVQEDLVDFDKLARKGMLAWTLAVYPKVKPILMGMQALYKDTLYGSYSKYLYDECLKRYPDAAAPKDRFITQ